MLFFWIALAAVGGFIIAWPIAYAWAANFALTIARKIIDREFDRLEEAQQALAELHKNHISQTEKRRKA